MSTETTFAQQANDLAITRLVLQMETIEEHGGTDAIEQYDIMSQAISYLARPEQLSALETRSIPQRWVDVVASS